MLNGTTTYNNTPVFPYSGEPTPATPKHLLPSSKPESDDNNPTESDTTSQAGSYLTTAADRHSLAAKAAATRVPDSELEGFIADPAATKVVDRRWYERNKHIYPASLWEEFDPERDYSVAARKDGEGNAYFFGR